MKKILLCLLGPHLIRRFTAVSIETDLRSVQGDGANTEKIGHFFNVHIGIFHEADGVLSAIE